MPPEGLSLEDLQKKWDELTQAEAVKEKAIYDEIAR